MHSQMRSRAEAAVFAGWLQTQEREEEGARGSERVYGRAEARKQPDHSIAGKELTTERTMTVEEGMYIGEPESTRARTFLLLVTCDQDRCSMRTRYQLEAMSPRNGKGVRVNCNDVLFLGACEKGMQRPFSSGGVLFFSFSFSFFFFFLFFFLSFSLSFPSRGMQDGGGGGGDLGVCCFLLTEVGQKSDNQMMLGGPKSDTEVTITTFSVRHGSTPRL